MSPAHGGCADSPDLVPPTRAPRLRSSGAAMTAAAAVLSVLGSAVLPATPAAADATTGRTPSTSAAGEVSDAVADRMEPSDPGGTDPRSSLLHGTVAYGPDPAQVYDVYWPAGSSTAARSTVFLIHGGGWTAGDKDDLVGTAEYYANAGFVTVSVNYRLVRGTVTLDQTVADVSAALDHVRANAEALRVDEDRIIAVGGSAGGHLAMTMGTLGRGSDRLRGVVVSAGMPALRLQNTVTAYQQGKAGGLVNRSSPKHGLSAARWYAKVDPYANAGPGDAPLLWMGSNKDTYVHPDLPWKLAYKLRGAGVSAKVVVADSKVHGVLGVGYKHRATARLRSVQWMRNRTVGAAIPATSTEMSVTAVRSRTKAKVTVKASTTDLPSSAPYSASYTVYRARPGSWTYQKLWAGRVSSGVSPGGVAGHATVSFNVAGVAKGSRVKVSLRGNGNPTVRATVLR